MTVIRNVAIVLAIAIAIYAWKQRNQLAHLGLQYHYVSNQSPTLKTIVFELKDGDEIHPGPEVLWTLLRVAFRDMDLDGQKEVVVFGMRDEWEMAVIKVLGEANEGPRFEVTHVRGLMVGYPEGNFIYP